MAGVDQLAAALEDQSRGERVAPLPHSAPDVIGGLKDARVDPCLM